MIDCNSKEEGMEKRTNFYIISWNLRVLKNCRSLIQCIPLLVGAFPQTWTIVDFDNENRLRYLRTPLSCEKSVRRPRMEGSWKGFGRHVPSVRYLFLTRTPWWIIIISKKLVSTSRNNPLVSSERGLFCAICIVPAKAQRQINENRNSHSGGNTGSNSFHEEEDIRLAFWLKLKDIDNTTKLAKLEGSEPVDLNHSTSSQIPR